MSKKIESTDYYGMGVDIGGTKILIAIANDSGKVVFKDKVKTVSDIDEIIKLIKDCLQRAEIDHKNLMGIGIGIPGRVNSRESIVIDAPALKWRNVNLKQVFSANFNFPVYINNDVNLSLVGEKWLGNGRGHDNLFYLAIGTGVGSAILANGNIIEGSTFSAGEIGYLIDKNDVAGGLRNTNQEFGTFEKKTSGLALSSAASAYGLSAPELFQEYLKGTNIHIIEDFITDISIAIANVVSLINPEIVIIGGGVSGSMPAVISKIRAKVAGFTPIQTDIVLSKLGGEAGALGGVAYVFKKQLGPRNHYDNIGFAF
jgi:Transcriptional regulator/sugar kinase